MAPLLDIVGSFILGGMILIMTTKLNFIISDNSQQANMSLSVQANCVVLSKVLVSDLSKAGYNCNSQKPIRISDSAKIKFYADIDDDGTLDSITYFTGPLTPEYASPNPRHRLLYRTWNTQTTVMNVGLTNMKFTYYDSCGAKTAQESNMRAVKVAMELESVMPNIDTVHAVVHWEQYINPKSFRYVFN